MTPSTRGGVRTLPHSREEQAMKCAYCGKEAEKLIKGKITFRSHDQRTGRAKLVTVEREYCFKG